MAKVVKGDDGGAYISKSKLAEAWAKILIDGFSAHDPMTLIQIAKEGEAQFVKYAKKVDNFDLHEDHYRFIYRKITQAARVGSFE
jgi:hypothetical protein